MLHYFIKFYNNQISIGKPLYALLSCICRQPKALISETFGNYCSHDSFLCDVWLSYSLLSWQWHGHCVHRHRAPASLLFLGLPLSTIYSSFVFLHYLSLCLYLPSSLSSSLCLVSVTCVSVSINTHILIYTYVLFYFYSEVWLIHRLNHYYDVENNYILTMLCIFIGVLANVKISTYTLL